MASAGYVYLFIKKNQDKSSDSNNNNGDQNNNETDFNNENEKYFKIVINEVYYGTPSEWWIELYNAGNINVSMTNWRFFFSHIDGPIGGFAPAPRYPW